MELISSQTNKCKNCGAELSEPVNNVATCNYCGSKFQVAPATEPTAIAEPEVVAPAAGVASSQSPADLLQYLAPTKKKVFIKYVLRGLGLWVIYWVIRAILPYFFGKNFSGYSSYYNNIFISPVGGVYWIIRGIVFVGIFPVLMTRLFYDRIVARYHPGGNR